MPPSDVDSFLAQLPADRRREVERVREVLLRHLPVGYEEIVSKGMLVYQVPLTRYSRGGRPLWYAAIASEKSYLSLHLMRIYADPAQMRRLEEAFRAAGKKLNVGKACIRFKAADDLELDVIGELVASTPAEQWVRIAERRRL